MHKEIEDLKSALQKNGNPTWFLDKFPDKFQKTNKNCTQFQETHWVWFYFT